MSEQITFATSDFASNPNHVAPAFCCWMFLVL